MTETLADAIAEPTDAEVLDETLVALEDEGCSMVGVPTTSADRGLIEIHARAMGQEKRLRSSIAQASLKTLLMQIEDAEVRAAWLTAVAKARYGLDRGPATKAAHRFRLVASAAAGPYTIAPRTLITQTDDGIQFRNTGRLASDLDAGPGTVTLALGATLSDLEWEALLPGVAGNIPADSSLSLVTTLAGVSVSNPEIADGSSLVFAGADAESDESLNARCDARWDRTAVSALPGALVTWIFESFEVDKLTSPVTKWRVDDTNPDGPGTTDLYASTAAEAGLTEVERARIDAYEQERRAVGTGALRTRAAPIYPLPFTATLYTLGRSGTVAADAAAVIDVLEAIVPLGGTLYGDDITKAYRSLTDVYHVVHSLEGVTTTLGEFEDIRLVPTVTVL